MEAKKNPKPSSDGGRGDDHEDEGSSSAEDTLAGDDTIDSEIAKFHRTPGQRSLGPPWVVRADPRRKGDDTIYDAGIHDTLSGDDGDNLLYGGDSDAALFGNNGAYFDASGGSDMLQAVECRKNFTFLADNDFTKRSGTGFDEVNDGLSKTTVIIKGVDKNAAVDFDFSDITL